MEKGAADSETVGQSLKLLNIDYKDRYLSWTYRQILYNFDYMECPEQAGMPAETEVADARSGGRRGTEEGLEGMGLLFGVKKML